MTDRCFNYDSVYKFMERNYMKNRTVVTKDIASILDDAEQTMGLEMFRHRYPTGAEHGTWQVPKQWDVKSAWLKDSQGNTIASHEDHPLFTCVYSGSVDKKVSKQELTEHCFTAERQPDAFAYKHHFAYDPHKQGKEWFISLPYKTLQNLKDDESYHIYIDVGQKDGEMLIGETTLPGKSKETIVFVSNICHPGQINDSFTGVALFMELMQAIQENKNRYYTYTFLILPETIGSSIYLASKSYGDKQIVGCVFSDTVGWGDHWYFKRTRKGHTYFDLLAEECASEFSELENISFMEGVGNDEHTFDSPQANIPSLSLQKWPYVEYHTSNDNLAPLKKEDLEYSYKIMNHWVKCLEADKTYEWAHSVPFHMSRFKLYQDFHLENQAFRRNKAIMNTLDGKTSLLEIARSQNLKFSEVQDFVKRCLEHDLLTEINGPRIIP